MYFTFAPAEQVQYEQVYSPKEAAAHWLIEQALAEGFEKAAAEKAAADKESQKKSTATSNAAVHSEVKKSNTEKTTSKKRKQPTVDKDASRSVRRTCNNRTALPTSTQTVIEQRTPLHVENETSESGGAAKMSLDVTGFAPNQIKLSVENSVVSIKGERTNKLGDKFVLDRKFRLDKKTTQAEKVTASFDGGILEVTIPTKKPEGAHRAIPIAVSTSTAASVEASSDDETSTSNSGKDDKTATEKTTRDADDSKKSEEVNKSKTAAEPKEKK